MHISDYLRLIAVLRLYSDAFSLVEVVGFEPTTLCLQGRCSSQLSYTPITKKYSKTAEHPIGTLAPREASIVYLPAELEPLTVAILVYSDLGGSRGPP